MNPIFKISATDGKTGMVPAPGPSSALARLRREAGMNPPDAYMRSRSGKSAAMKIDGVWIIAERLFDTDEH